MATDENNNKIIPPKPIYIISMVALFVFIWVTSIHITYSYEDFAIDEEGNVYVGRTAVFGEVIHVYSDKGDVLKEIKFRFGDLFIMDIKDDKLIVTNDNSSLIMDLDGNILEEKEGIGEEKFYELYHDTKKFTASDGTTYTSSNLFLHYTITREDGTRVFTEPTLEYILKILTFNAFVGIFVIAFTMMLKHKAYFMNYPNWWK